MTKGMLRERNSVFFAFGRVGQQQNDAEGIAVEDFPEAFLAALAPPGLRDGDADGHRFHIFGGLRDHRVDAVRHDLGEHELDGL